MTASIDLLSLDPVPCIIDNQPVGDKSNTFSLADPHTGEHKYNVNSATPDIARRAIESAAKAFQTWKNYSPLGRRKIFQRAHQLMLERRDEFIQLAFEETTSSKFWASKNVDIAAEALDETASLATALTGSIAPIEHGTRSYIERIPYGVVFGIAPWNASLILSLRAYTSAIMAGNTVVLKTSEYSPKAHLFGMKLFMDAGLPAGVLNLIHMSPQDAPPLCELVIAHPAVRKVNFTGSTLVGRKIGVVCAKHIKPVTLELGGKAPVIILPNADLEVAAVSCMFGSFLNSGQICMSSDILLVHESIADEFIAIMHKHMATRPAAAQPETLTGNRGVFNDNSAKRITGMIQEALDKGAKVVAGQAKTDKSVIQPVMIEGTTPEMRIYSEEIFGPAMTVTRYKDVEEAIRLSNQSEYGLSASVFGSDERECLEVASQIEAGQVHINGPTVSDRTVCPHGGLKNSGFGRFNGIEGLREFTTTRTISVNIPHAHYPM